MIIETKIEFDSFLEKYQDSSCILIPVLCDVNKHPLENSLCLLYVKILGGDEYVLPFNHSEAINLGISYLDKLNLNNKKYTFKALLPNYFKKLIKTKRLNF